MNLIFLATQATTEATKTITLHPIYILYALGLIFLTIFLIKIIKNVIVNSIVGVVGLLFFYYVLNIKLPFIITLIVTAILGPAGLGIMLILKVFGGI